MPQNFQQPFRTTQNLWERFTTHISSERQQNALGLLTNLQNYSEIIRKTQKDQECCTTAQNIQEPLKIAQNPWEHLRIPQESVTVWLKPSGTV